MIVQLVLRPRVVVPQRFRAKHALGLDPRVDTRISTKNNSAAIELASATTVGFAPNSKKRVPPRCAWDPASSAVSAASAQLSERYAIDRIGPATTAFHMEEELPVQKLALKTRDLLILWR